MCIFDNCLHRCSEYANTKCAVEHCYNTMLLNDYEINEKYDEWLKLGETHHQIFMDSYKDYITGTRKHFTGRNLANYKKWWVARYLISIRPKESTVVAKYITRGQTVYECPTCWNRYNNDGTRHKKSKPTLHTHGFTERNGVLQKMPHCRFDNRIVWLHITDETERKYL